MMIMHSIMMRIVHFEILNGKRIIINYFNDIDSELIQSMLNYPVACLAAQKKYLCLHSSAVELNGKVYLFPVQNS